MGYIVRHTLLATCTASGGAANTFYTNGTINGLVQAISYKRGTTGTTSSGISTGAKIVMTAELTGLPVLTIATASADNMYFYPRAYSQDASGAQLGYTSAGTPPGIPTFIPVANERIKVVVTSGGAASAGGTRGVFDFWIEGA